MKKHKISNTYDAMILASSQNDYPIEYKKYLKFIKKNALKALNVPVNNQNKLRALIMLVFPKFVPWIMELRRKKYNVEI